MAYSHSRLSTYENCPQKYKFAYVDRLKIEEEGIEAFLGSRFHQAMEKLYNELRFRIMPLEEVKNFYEEQWKKNYHDKVIIVEEGRTADDYFRLGLKFIEDYYRHYYPFNRNRVLGTEEWIEVDLDGSGRYILQGIVDRIDLTPDGVYEIHDYKTSSSLPGQDFADNDRQLAVYQLGLKQKWPQAEKFRLVWHYVAFDLELSSTRTQEQLDQLRSQIIQLIQQIQAAEAANDFPARESALCRWCAFWDYCPIKKHEAALEKLPVNEYLKEEGVVLVNKYIEYFNQKKEAEIELEKLKEAIIKYAEDRGLRRVMGSEFHLTLKKQERLQFPGSGDTQKIELENLIRQAGLWEKFSSLDRYNLERAIKSGQLEPGLLEKLLKLVKKETVISLHPAKNASSED